MRRKCRHYAEGRTHDKQSATEVCICLGPTKICLPSSRPINSPAHPAPIPIFRLCLGAFACRGHFLDRVRSVMHTPISLKWHALELFDERFRANLKALAGVDPLLSDKLAVH